MPHRRRTRSRRLATGLVASIAALWLLPATAAAACLEWNISRPGAQAAFSQANGYNLHFKFNQGANGYLGGPVSAYPRAGGRALHGSVILGRVTGSRIHFTINWGGGRPFAIYNGTIFESIGGTGATGTTHGVSWRMLSRPLCVRRG